MGVAWHTCFAMVRKKVPRRHVTPMPIPQKLHACYEACLFYCHPGVPCSPTHHACYSMPHTDIHKACCMPCASKGMLMPHMPTHATYNKCQT